MILSTFRHFAPYRLHCLVVGILGAAIFSILSQKYLSIELIPGSVMPDTAYAGYSPDFSRLWYVALSADDKKLDRIIILLLGLLDFFVILPAYLFGFGSHLLQRQCPQILCYLPVWTGCFDLIESLTTFATIACIHFQVYWVPSSFQLLLASAATQFKGVCFALCVVMTLRCSFRHRLSKKK